MSRINLSQRIIIESGIYQRLNLTEIAKKIGMSVTAVSNEIKLNRTPAKGSKPHGNDCRFANECEEKNLCCNFDCKRKCVWCFDFNCRELCSKYDNSPCSVLQKPPYALYLLDEPENSLSPKRQIELAQFIEEAARFYRCQFIISTHSPFLLALPFAKIYNLDLVPVTTSKWTELENVQTYFRFFEKHRQDFINSLI